MTTDEMAYIASLAQCRVTKTKQFVSLVPGEPGLAWEVRCPSHAAKVKLLDLLAWYDAKKHVGLRQVALALGGEAGPKPEKLARAIQKFVQKEVRFTREPNETFQSSYVTLVLGAGDCDDHARVVAALGRALGLKVRLATLGRNGAPTHVAAQFGFPVKRPTVWLWAETTLKARFGEPPRAAKRRLREERADI